MLCKFQDIKTQVLFQNHRRKQRFKHYYSDEARQAKIKEAKEALVQIENAKLDKLRLYDMENFNTEFLSLVLKFSGDVKPTNNLGMGGPSAGIRGH